MADEGVHHPSLAETERAMWALGPSVRRWGLSLNPEDIQFMAYAALRHATGTLSPEAILNDVNRMLDEEDAKQERWAAERRDEER